MAAVSDHVRFAIGDAGRLAYRVYGEGEPVIMLAPGFGSHLDLMAGDPWYHRFMTGLSSFARVVVFDKRGAGMSDPVDHIPTFEERSRDWLTVMDAVEVDRAWLFGHSESGPSAIVCATTNPERVHGLILASAFATFSLDHRNQLVAEGLMKADELDRAEAIHQEILDRIPTEWGTGRVLSVIMPENAGPLIRQAVSVVERRLGSARQILQEIEAWRAGDVSSLLPMVTVPALVLHRSEEYVPLAVGQYIAREIPNASFRVIDGHEHAIWAGKSSDVVVDEVAQFVRGIDHAPDRPSTKLTTVLFTDIVSSTERAVEAGDGWTDLLADCHVQTRGQIEAFGGSLVKSLGDGVLASFPGPVAAVRCAASLTAFSGEIGLPIRAGVHTGEAEILADGDLAGVAIHFAARVMAQATAGQILVSSVVRDLSASGGLDFASVGTHRLKGFDGEHELFASSLGELPSAEPGMPTGLLRQGMVTATVRFPRLTRSIVRSAQRIQEVRLDRQRAESA